MYYLDRDKLSNIYGSLWKIEQWLCSMF